MTNTTPNSTTIRITSKAKIWRPTNRTLPLPNKKIFLIITFFTILLAAWLLYPDIQVGNYPSVSAVYYLSLPPSPTMARCNNNTNRVSLFWSIRKLNGHWRQQF